MKTKPWILLAALPLFALGACEENSPAEEAADDVGEAAEETGEAIEEGAEETGEAVEDAFD
jgi:hypothetical protein